MVEASWDYVVRLCLRKQKKINKNKRVCGSSSGAEPCTQEVIDLIPRVGAGGETQWL
jgi:hypothetical protein